MRSPPTTWRRNRFRAFAGLAVAALVILVSCARRAPERAVPDFARELAAGGRYVERLGKPALTDEQVIAAGYLERLRVGMGSPFRLMEYALRDPRLTPATRAPLAWAMLDATLAGRGYEIDPQALARIGSNPRVPDLAVARAHLELIERAVGGAQDPRAGELAVREAYRLAMVGRAVAPSAPTLAAWAAALTRDRELARGDAGRLLAHAARIGKHPFALLVVWRQQRVFEVEAPPGAPRAAALEEEAAASAVLLAEQVAALRPAQARRVARLPRLDPATARRLAEIARARSHPTQSPIWITVQRYEDQLRRRSPRSKSVKRFMERARTEETFIAEQARLGGAAAPVREVIALATLEAGIGMRAYAQERVWLPGFPAPSVIDLKREYGLRAVRFDGDVPLSWRPYYRRMLWDALADLEVVLPGLDLRGATFTFGATGREGVAFAIHDPDGRIIRLPPESGAGAIAHEVGHDLDWQVAHALYGTRASYGTEHALRTRRGDAFAMAARRMPTPEEVLMRGGPEIQRRYAQRPAEIFARTFDGYVAAALAQKGRSNGYLSAAQDDFIGGHGLALLPGARTDAAGPFMEMMKAASPIPEPARREFLARWGEGRVPTGFDVASRILARAGTGALPSPAAAKPGMAELLAAGARVREDVAEVAALRDSAVAEWRAASCANPLAARGARGEASVRHLADAAVEARVRGIVLVRARSLGLESAPLWLRDAWVGTIHRHGPLFTRTRCG